MASEKGITEVADSEDELRSSSPVFVPEEALDKLSAQTYAPSQERHDASEQAVGSRVDRNEASIDVDALNIDQTDMQLDNASQPQQEGAAGEACNNDPGVQTERKSPQLTTNDTPRERHVAEPQAVSANERGAGEDMALETGTSYNMSSEHQDTNLMPIDAATAENATIDSTANSQDEQPSSATHAGEKQPVTEGEQNRHEESEQVVTTEAHSDALHAANDTRLEPPNSEIDSQAQEATANVPQHVDMTESAPRLQAVGGDQALNGDSNAELVSEYRRPSDFVYDRSGIC
ncbi:hypothetical protein EJ02DRAFT_171729 [Clathrospora elynae]|uniref:Uncharacterized protein n=1 Tax=Clathrospora elynae TaxID=706981 RepID=A0A6A5TDQ9_9PLEO|nr:hypothetical protein EJ02DRAFT_171729 [Clathrospora elynae]